MKQSERAYAIDSRGGGAVLKDDTELGELAMDLEEVRKEPRFGVEDAAALYSGRGSASPRRRRKAETHIAVDIARDLSMQVEDHVDLLHLSKHLIKHAVALHAHASFRVGRHAPRVTLDPDDTSCVSLANLSGGETRGEVHGGEEVGVGRESLQLF